jgi:predicted transcriptional regulator
MHATTLSFRAGDEVAKQTMALAESVGLKKSDYIREAVREKNERVMAQRIALLSKALSAEHLSINHSLDQSIADGLDKSPAWANLRSGLRATIAQRRAR